MMPSPDNEKKAWLLIASNKNWELAQEHAVFGVPGNRGFLRQIKKGDMFVAYVPKVGFIGYGKIESSYYVAPPSHRIWEDGSYSHRFQLATPFLSNKVLPAAAVVDDLEFVTNKGKWGVFFKAGIREIPLKDAALISKKLIQSASVLPQITEKTEKALLPAEIGAELHNRVLKLCEDLGFAIVDNNYYTAGPDITIVDPWSKENSKIIIQCKNSKDTKTTFANLDKHLNEYSGRLKTNNAAVAIIAVTGDELPKKVPGEEEELDIDEILKKYGVAIWTEETLDYYEKLIQKISHFARYQVLSDLGLKLSFDDVVKFDAIRVIQNGITMYAAALDPEWLLKTVSVVRRVRMADGTKGYQRLLDKARVSKTNKRQSIPNYLDNTPNWLFPNAIVLASSKVTGLDFENGSISLKSIYGQFWVIDGQHRLFAFANSNARKSDNKILCVIIDSNSFNNERSEESELAQIFVTLNGKAQRVPKALLYELYQVLGSDDNPALEVVLRLFEDKFFVEDIRGYSDKGSINLVAFADAKGTKSIYAYFSQKSENKPKEKKVESAANFILKSFKEIARIFPEEWSNPDEFFLKSDRGVVGMLDLLSVIIKYHGHKIDYVIKALEALKEADFDFTSETAKGLYLGAGGPDRLSKSFARKINQTLLSEFVPADSSRHEAIPPVMSKRGEETDNFYQEWLPKLEGNVRCKMDFIDASTAKYLAYLDKEKVSSVRVFFGNCMKDSPKKIRDSIKALQEQGLNITFTQSQKKTEHRGSFWHARWIGDDKIQIRPEMDLKDNSQVGGNFYIYVDLWKNSPEVEDFDRYWNAAEMNRDAIFSYDWVNAED